MATNSNRRGGIVFLSINGQGYDVKGPIDITYDSPVRTAIVGQDGVHGYKEMPRAAKFKGKLTDRGDLDLKALFTAKDVTAVGRLANGKTVTLRDAFYSGEATSNTEEGEVDIELTGMSLQEV